MDESRFIVSASPHIRHKDSIPRIMWTVAITLAPAIVAGTYFFGPRILMVMLISIASAVATEAVIQKLMKRKVTVSDGSAVVTGMLLAMVIPPSVPFWVPIVGSFCAIAIAKSVFGGIGYNIFNPALIGRAILLASFPSIMTAWTAPGGIDATTTATPLSMLKGGAVDGLPSIWDMFSGRIGGCIGETCAIALLIGAAYLLIKGYITWHIPISYIGTVAVVVGLGQIGDGSFKMIPFHVFGGGLILGAFFMATDMVTTPVTKKGGLIFGVGAGIITCVIRTWGGYPEGVCYSILLMNAFTPLIDKYVKPHRFGIEKKRIFTKRSVGLMAALAITCLLSALALTLVNNMTKDRIAEQKLYAELDAVSKEVLRDVEFDNQPSRDSITIPDLEEEDGTPKQLYLAKKGGDLVAVVFKHAGEGYGGSVVLMVGLDMDGKVVGIKVLEHDETPGLGAKIETDKSFTEQFRGKHLGEAPDEELEVMEGEPAKESWQVEGITGATISTYAVVEIVNEAFMILEDNEEEILEAASKGGK